MSNPIAPDHSALFDWPNEKPVARTVKQFAGDTIAGIASKFPSLAAFSAKPTIAGYDYVSPGGIRIRAGWKLSNLRSSRHGGKRPCVIEVNFEPHGREFSLFARMEFRPYFEVEWDGQRARHTCTPDRISLQGGSGDMEKCHQWLLTWKLYR